MRTNQSFFSTLLSREGIKKVKGPKAFYLTIFQKYAAKINSRDFVSDLD